MRQSNARYGVPSPLHTFPQEGRRSARPVFDFQTFNASEMLNVIGYKRGIIRKCSSPYENVRVLNELSSFPQVSINAGSTNQSCFCHRTYGKRFTESIKNAPQCVPDGCGYPLPPHVTAYRIFGSPRISWGPAFPRLCQAEPACIARPWKRPGRGTTRTSPPRHPGQPPS